MSGPEQNESPEQRLARLDDLLARGVINDAEHQTARQAVINETAMVPASAPGQQPQQAFGQTPVVSRGGHIMISITQQMIEQRGHRAFLFCHVCHQRALQPTDPYYHCESTNLTVCKRCGDENRHLRVIPSFHTGLFGCCTDCGSCVDATLCFYCQLAQMEQILGKGVTEMPSDMNPTPGIINGCHCANCARGMCLAFGDLFTLTLCSACVVCAHQASIIQRFHINSGICFLECILCRQCMLAQNHREMTARGLFPGGVCLSKQPNRAVSTMAPPTPAIMLEVPQRQFQRPAAEA